MKRLILVFLLAALLTGCSAMKPGEYLSVAPHVEPEGQTDKDRSVTAENYLSLKNAILGFVKNGQTEGIIRITSYDGDVESDLAAAAYEVSKQDPLGAYAVDYMTHECSRIVSYYEIRIHITFRRTAAEIAAIESVSTSLQLQSKIETALANYDSRLTLRISSFRELDIPLLAEHYCSANPATMIEAPQVEVTMYPNSGSVRILEIDFLYSQEAEALLTKKTAVKESIDGAAEYIRYRKTDRDKADLLFTYLTERFFYAMGETVTPLYSALCDGVADPLGLAQAWQLICDQAGVTCYTVSGFRNGEAYTWNIVSADGYYRHLDLARCIMETGALKLQTDQEMGAYYWNTDIYPACLPLPEPPAKPEPPEEPPAEAEAPEEEEPMETKPEEEPVDLP